jgi:hypothetical protein
MENDMKCKLDIAKKREQEGKLENLEWILQDPAIDGKARYHVWQSLYKSKLSYATNLLTMFDSKTRKWF